MPKFKPRSDKLGCHRRNSDVELPRNAALLFGVREHRGGSLTAADFISRSGSRIDAIARRTVPDPFVLAVLLTALTVVLSVVLTGTSLWDSIAYWSGAKVSPARLAANPKATNAGVWELLAFSMQMCMILVTGHVLADSKPVRHVLIRLCRVARGAKSAVFIVALVACTLGVINWGLGLIAGAILARRMGDEFARRGVGVNRAVLAAAGYMGLLVWHGGLSGSAPLNMTRDAEIARVFAEGARPAPISLSDTIGSPMNIFITGGLIVIVPMVIALIAPAGDGGGGAREKTPAREPEDHQESLDAAQETKAFIPRLLEDTPIVNYLLSAMILAWALWYYQSGQRVMSLDLNAVCLTMLMLGLVAHGTPTSLMRSATNAAAGCAGILIQFPLYAGIMALMRESGLTAMMAEAMAGGAGERTLPLMTFLSAAIVNLFVPSGGGQWAIQGPIALHSAAEIGVAPAKMVLAVAYGDQLTNMLQPFWALPLLAITGVKAREIVGYTAMVMAVAAVWVMLGLVVM